MTDLNTEDPESLATQKAPMSPNRLEPLAKSRHDLNKIQTSLNALIDTMAQNPSILSRASKFWGNRPIWQKIITGLILIAPTLVLGIVANMTALWIISICTLILYVGSSVILDNHHSHNKMTTKNIQAGVSSLAQTLSLIIESLEAIRERLAMHIDTIEKENAKLALGVQALGLTNESLNQEITALTHVEQKLKATEYQLTQTCKKLKLSVKRQTQLAAKAQMSLEQYKTEYANNLNILNNRIEELEGIKTQLALDVKQRNHLITGAEAGANEFIKQLNNITEEQRQEFAQKIKSLITNEDLSLQSIEDYLAVEREELVKIKTQYEQKLTEMQNNLDTSANHVGRLCRIIQSLQHKEDNQELEEKSTTDSPSPHVSQLSFLRDRPSKTNEITDDHLSRGPNSSL